MINGMKFSKGTVSNLKSGGLLGFGSGMCLVPF